MDQRYAGIAIFRMIKQQLEELMGGVGEVECEPPFKIQACTRKWKDFWRKCHKHKILLFIKSR
jgi:hypothetical protein